MFIELLRAHEGYYTPLHRPDLTPAVVFGTEKLLQHQALANQFVEACRMTPIHSTAPPPAQSDTERAEGGGFVSESATGMHRHSEAHDRDLLKSFSKPAHVPPQSRWSDAESTLLW